VEATVNVSELGQDFVNAAFYMIANPTDPGKQPKGQNYCDAGGNKSEWNCRELDFIETNGNKITQTSMHLGNGGISAPQRWEFSFAETAKADNCFNYQNMLSSPTPTNGLHSLVGGINLKRPFNVRTTFSYGSPPSMRTTFIQSGSSVVVYDTAVGTGAEGSKLNSFGDLIQTMKDGYWLLASFWQGYSPKGPGDRWWTNCTWGKLCNSDGGYWRLNNVVVTAERELP
jgi:hypothetical protein